MIELKKSPVVFIEEMHTYMLGDKRLLGITGLIHSVLGLGVYPDASEYAKDYLIPKAGSRGTAVHHAIQMYDELGVTQTQQTVKTRYGCRERENLHYVDETWDVAYELESYIRHCIDFMPVANEYTVSDEKKWASQIDNVWQHRKTKGIWLIDTKTNNIDLYPLCGYYNPFYFNTGEEALREYLSWQLSIYAVLFERKNPGVRVEGLACNWLRKDNHSFWLIERKPDELVEDLLSSDYSFTCNGPIYYHPAPERLCPDRRNIPASVNDTMPIVQQDVVDYVSELMRQSREIERKLSEAKEAIRAAMEKHGVKSFDFGAFSVSLSADGVSSSFDVKSFKRDHPELYDRYVGSKPRKGSFTIKIKEQ